MYFGFIWGAAQGDHKRDRLEADPRAVKQMREVKYSILHSLTVTGSLWKMKSKRRDNFWTVNKISLRPNVVRDNEVGAASRRQLHFQAQD